MSYLVKIIYHLLLLMIDWYSLYYRCWAFFGWNRDGDYPIDYCNFWIFFSDAMNVLIRDGCDSLLVFIRFRGVFLCLRFMCLSRFYDPCCLFLDDCEPRALDDLPVRGNLFRILLVSLFLYTSRNLCFIASLLGLQVCQI